MASEAAYLYDDSLRDEANRRGENCWFRYVEEIFDQLGVRADALPFAAAARNGRALAGRRVLVLGDYGAAGKLPPASLLRDWVAGGGVLIGLGTKGLDELFGIASAGPDVSAAPFTIAGWMSLQGRDEAAGLTDGLFPETLCPIMAPFRRIALKGAIGLAEIVPGDASAAGAPARLTGGWPCLARRNLGKGRAYYFAFDLAQAIWTYHRGRPVTEDLDKDGYLRSSDGIIVPQGAIGTVPCADLMLLILENIFGGAAIPMVHQLPPLDGRLPDALFHYGGDDEGLAGLQAKMSETMKRFGLPYHVNVMLRDGEFHFSDEDRALYARNGHEFSLHFNFINYPEGVKHPAPVEEAELDRQLRLFTSRYGKVPICSNNHFCRTSGWADTARYAARRGIRGENHRAHHVSPPMDPVNLFGAAFGTVYPHFVYDDAAHGNERLDFVDIPIGFYEPGSATGETTHPFYGRDAFQPAEYRRIVDLACRYGWTLNLFMHPTHMSLPTSRGKDALRCMLDRIAENRAVVAHTGTDALCLWWHARARTKLVPGADARTHAVETDHEEGVLVKFLEQSLPPGASWELDGRPAAVERRGRRGRSWLYIPIPKGRHSLRTRMESA